MNKHFLTIATLGIGLAAPISAAICHVEHLGELRWIPDDPDAGRRIEFHRLIDGELCVAHVVYPSARVIKKNFEVSDFQEIAANGMSIGMFRIVFEQTDGPCSLEVEGPDNFLDYLRVKSDGGRLRMRMGGEWDCFKADINRKVNGIVCRVRARSLKKLFLRDVSAFKAARIHGDTFELKVTGMCKAVIADLQADTFKLLASGSIPCVSVAGVVKNEIVELGQFSRYDARYLQSEKCSIKREGQDIIIGDGEKCVPPENPEHPRPHPASLLGSW